MKPPFDIREYKKEKRSKYRAQRRNMSSGDKASKDAVIRRHVLSMREYKKFDTFLCFVSLPEEINTHPLLEQAIKDGKQVGVPYCIPGTRELEFYQIKSLNELTVQSYGLLEPTPEPKNKIVEFEKALCILPGLAFDKFGFRLGYGGGYYDRFLASKFKGVKAGICYQNAVRGKLIHGRFDIPCNYIITERGIRRRQSSPKKQRPAGR